ncbi:MAG: glycosyltransferase family 9 protein [Muribaculaceae bacterium]|nr:glycosyltransferase family 9 protein [Muribaculaceae bacterium]
MESVSKYKNVLVSRFSALGDVAMTVPVIYSACRCYPSTRFIVVTQKVAATLFVNAPANLVVVPVDVKGTYRGVRGMFRLLSDLRRNYPIDAYVDLHSVIRTYALGLACMLRGIPVRRIRKGRSDKRALTRRSQKELHRLCTSRDRYFDVFKRMGFDFPEAFDSIFDEPVSPEIFADITEAKRPGERWVAIAPFAKHVGKIYPPELMKQVVDTLAARPDVRLFLFGGGDGERDILRGWAEGRANVISMAEKRHGFPKELALLSHMDAAISMDSANMHLASLVRVPVVSIWGATHPYCGFTGWKQSDDNAVQLDMPCRPCSVFGNRPCRRGDYACLYGIKPQDIIDRLDHVLDK